MQKDEILSPTTTLSQIPVNIPQLKNQESTKSNPQHYFFQTQTKNLKIYYLEHQNELIKRRILFNNSIGTVRYFGYLQHQHQNNQKQLWIGIQWDEEGRGKHNGTVNGFQYFKCRDKQGSLIKYQKIQFGYKLQTALFKRYFKSEELHHAKNIYESLKTYKQELKNQDQSSREQKCEEMIKKKIHKIQYDSQAYVQTLKKNKRIMVEFVGFDQIWTKINNLDKIQTISLAQCRICDLGPSGHLNGLLKNLKALSLQDNLISDYDQFYQLGMQLPQLCELSLRNNQIQQPQLSFQNVKEVTIVGHHSKIKVQSKYIFENLKCLILINTGLTWKTLFKILPAIKQINELVLCKNQNLTDYQNIDLNKFTYLQHLNFLNLQQTNLKSFDPIRKFKDLPNLQKLILNHNPLSQFGRDISGFQNVKSMSVQFCQIKKPVVLYQLSNFKNMQNLNIKHNPVSDLMGNAYVRLRAVAECQKLVTINGAMLKKYERKDCQIFYMRQSFREYFALKNKLDYDYDFDDFLKYCQEHHPNINFFIKKFGNPYEVQKKQQIKQMIKTEVKQNQIKKGTGMIQLQIQVTLTESKFSKKVPLSWTVANLKNLFAKTLKIPVGNQKLMYKVDKNSTLQLMNEDHKPLSFYGLSQESTLILDKP